MERNFEFKYWHVESLDELDSQDRELVEHAQAATAKAQAPYSNFQVGAAARLRSGKIIYGSNIESEVYPSTLCAERTLLYHAASYYPNDPIDALAIASNPSPRECYPCGQCRQVLVDSQRRQGSPIRVIMSSDSTATIVDSAELLLPFTFKL